MAYHDGKKKKIRFIVHPATIIDEDGYSDLWEPSSSNTSRLLSRLEKLIGSYIISDCELNDFKLDQIDFAVDIDVGSRDTVADYIKVLRNVGRVKCFSPLKPDECDRVTKASFFGLMGNSNGVEFRACALKNDKQVLRVEVRLTSKGAIRAYSGDGDTSEQISSLAKSSRHIIMDTFNYVVPRGDYYKKNKADTLIRERVADRILRRKMLRLVDLIPEKSPYTLPRKP